ncbi:MFS transporter [Nocardioides sp. CN2-186]|uniref:MFS transporter n=1 Tax=Nocardioides tweenelious TaxID=3156607 RepID=UPI0032B407A8
MPGVAHAGSIREVIAGPDVARTFALALVGRLSYGLLPLCLLFTVRDSSGSFAVAAASSAAVGIATLAMPVQARLVDRWGQRRVLPWYALLYAALLGAAALLAGTTPPDAVWVATGLFLGLCAPALGPAMRAQWREIAPEGPPRRIAYSIDSVAEESLYLVGPLAAGVVLATGPARVGLFLAAGLILVGTAGLVTSPYVPAPAAPASVPRTRGLGVLRQPGLGVLLLVMVAAGASGATCLIGVAAIADDAGVPGAVGAVEAGMAVGAILAGLAWARLRRDLAWPAALGLLLTVSCLAQAGAAVAAPHLVLVSVLLVAVGAAAAPVYVVAFTGADSLVDPEQRTEASTWVSTALNGGNAAGTALAGLLLVVGAAAPFVVAALLSAVAAGTALARAVRSRRSTGRPARC